MRKLLKFNLKVVAWLALSLSSREGGSMPVSACNKLITRLQDLNEHKGQQWTLEYMKSCRVILLSYLSGKPVRLSGVAVTGDGIPKVLGDLIPIIRGGSALAISLVLTVLYSTRSLKLGGPVDFASITQPCKGDVTNLAMYAGSFWRELGYHPVTARPRSMRVSFDTYRSKSGPNGHALATSFVDAQALPASLVASLETISGPQVGHLVRVAGNSIVHRFLKMFLKIKVKTKNPVIRRLGVFKDKEAKMRVVGILDWYSQACLKPLHIYLANALKKVRQDCTFDQSHFRKSLKGAKVFYSVDLSSATDRFPLALIKQVLAAQLPSDYVEAWADVMVGYPFEFKGREFIYATGNPMGAYSSFNSFALTHHYLIYYCCKVLGKNWKVLPYALLGDDIVIGDSQVGDMYLSLIKNLGVDYSVAKTHTSEKMFEFAKRLFYLGIEISPFPISALKECGKAYDMLTTLLYEQNKRNWVPTLNIWSSVSLYQKVVLNRSSSFAKKVEEKSWACNGVLSLVHGTSPANELLNELICRRGYRLPQLSEEVCRNILSNTIVATFAESNILKSTFTDMWEYPLSGLTHKLYNSWEKYKANLSDEERFLLPRACPPRDFFITQAQRAVAKEFNELIKQLEEKDRTGSDWSYKLRVFALPRTDKSILDKGQYTLSKAVRNFADRLDEQLQVLEMYPQLLQA